ncbi:MAG: hypothetical protein R3351_07910 [Nitrospirales bacterium]|nr:hypothetical protein [Nitrospirales bacterium]
MMKRGRSITNLFISSIVAVLVLPILAGVGIAQGMTVEERLERLEQKTLSHSPGAEQETGNMVFFRGGWAGLVNDRSKEVFTDVFGASGSTNDKNNGYYVGAGLDLVLSRDAWGMMSGTWVLGEIGVEYKRWNSEEVAQAVPTTCAAAGIGTCSVELKKKVQLTMLTVDVAPKIMFMEGSRFRPWIIPVGLDFHVISPPSNDTTVLDIGVQFAVGAQYRLWKAVHLGVDGRFHLATGQTDTTNNFGTAGAYLGIAF